MRFLKEAFGESEELNTFVSQLNKRFNPYWEVELKLDGKEMTNYFAYESAAQEYYDKLVNDALSDLTYYEGAQISKRKIDLIREESDEEFKIIEPEDEEEIFD